MIKFTEPGFWQLFLKGLRYPTVSAQCIFENEQIFPRLTCKLTLLRPPSSYSILVASLFILFFVLGMGSAKPHAQTSGDESTGNDGIGNPILADFDARQLGEGVILDWRIVQGQFCINMAIQRTLDTLDAWTQLGEFGGVCGSDERDVWYEWFDDSGVDANTTYFYRIWASNGTVVSNTVSVDIRDSRSGQLSIVPNPLRENSSIFYSNSNGERIFLEVVDMQGQSLFRSESAAFSQFLLNRGSLNPGMVLVKIRSAEDGSVLACSKMQVL